MKVLILGGGDFASHMKRALTLRGDEVAVVGHDMVDLTSYYDTAAVVEATMPDFIVGTAGLSDRKVGANITGVVASNLITQMHVGTAAAAFGIPCLLIASTAGIDPGIHAWYGAAKAGVINFVRAMGKEHKIWALSPGRIDTKMRQDDWPHEDPKTRLNPGEVIRVVYDIMSGWYAPGANVIVRKVGTGGRIDIYEEPVAKLPSLL